MDTAWAAIVLMLSPAVPEQVPPLELWPQARVSLQETAIEWELMDRRETSYLFALRDDFQADIDTIRRRREQLADAPRIGESLRLPDRSLLNERCAFNRKYRQHLEQRLELEPHLSAQIQEAIAETDQLYRMYDYARDARCEFYYLTVRRLALKRFRDSVTEDVFATMELPPSAPLWRFSEIDTSYRSGE